MFATIALLLEILATTIPPQYMNSYVVFLDEPRRVIMQLEVPDVLIGDCLIVDATAQISARDPWNGNYPNNLYVFPGAAFLASQVLMYDHEIGSNEALDVAIGGPGVTKITHPSGVDLNVATSIPYVQPTLHGLYKATEDMGSQWIALVMWTRSSAAGQYDYLRVFPDNHAGISVQKSECGF